jgi:integrase
MKRTKTRTNAVDASRKAKQFNKVFNDKGERARGLWERKGSYYAQLDANNGKQYKYPLHDATTVPQAVTEMQALKKLQREEKLFPPRVTEKEAQIEYTDGRTLRQAIAEYKTHRAAMKAGDEKTWHRQDSGLSRWEEKFGTLPLTKLDDAVTKEYAKWRQSKHGGKVSGRTVDLDVGALHHVIDRCVELHWLPKSPLSKWKTLNKGPKRRVRLITSDELHRLCKAARLDAESLSMIPLKYRHLRAAQAVTGQAFSDYLYLLAYSGGREQETLKQRWSNVKWDRQVLFFPGALAKKGGGKPAPDRDVDFNKKLETHLKAMYERRDPNSDWLFPSDRHEGPVGSFKKQLERVKKATGILDVGFHHFRHYFISHCVMAQPPIDYMTIAIWVSHRDGGVLIGRVYSHLRPGHSAQMARHLDDAFQF